MTQFPQTDKEQEEHHLSKSGLLLRGVMLYKLVRGIGAEEATHNLAEFEEIILQKRREFYGKWLLIFAVACGLFFLAGSSLPAWVCVPFFLLAALIVFSWFKVGIYYLILRKADNIIEYRLRDTPAFIRDFFEKMSANVQSVNANVRLSDSRR